MVEVDGVAGGSQLRQSGAVEDGFDVSGRFHQHAVHDVHLFVAIRIVETQLHHESVDLCLGEGVGAFLLDRVLGGEHHERLLELVGGLAQGYLPLFHALEKGGLDLGGSAIDFVGK